MSDKFHECECDFVTTLTLTRVHSLDLYVVFTINTTVKTYMFSFTRLSIVNFAFPHCIDFTIVSLVFLFPSRPCFLSLSQASSKASPGNATLALPYTDLLAHSLIPHSLLHPPTRMPRDKNDDDKGQRGNDDNNERRRQKKNEEEKKKKEAAKKKVQRKKRANRPALADTPADLSLDRLFNVKEEGSADAGSTTAPPINVAPLFSGPPADDDQRRLNAALHPGGQDEEDDDDAVDYDEEGLLDDDGEGMEVDPPCDLLQVPSLPTSSTAPPPPQATPTQVERVIGQLKAGEMEVEPAQPWVPRHERQGPPPPATRTVGCQVSYGRETLDKRLKRLVVARARYAEVKRKRKLEAEAQPAQEAANSPTAAQVTPTPPPEITRPAFMQAKRPRVEPPGKSPPSGRAEVPGGKPGTSRQRGGKAAVRGGGKSMGPAGEAAKDQRVVVVLPSESPAAKATPPTRDDRPRSRSPHSRSSPKRNYDRHALPQRSNPSFQEQRHRSASRSAYDQKEKELERKEKEDRRLRDFPPRRRSPSPRPSSSRHHSLPSSMPNLSSGSAEEIQWMVAAMTAAFTASQQFRSRRREDERRDHSPSPSSSHRSRSYSRKGKGPGRGKGGRR